METIDREARTVPVAHDRDVCHSRRRVEGKNALLEVGEHPAAVERSSSLWWPAGSRSMPQPISASVIDVVYSSLSLRRTQAATTGDGDGRMSSAGLRQSQDLSGSYHWPSPPVQVVGSSACGGGTARWGTNSDISLLCRGPAGSANPFRVSVMLRAPGR